MSDDDKLIDDLMKASDDHEENPELSGLLLEASERLGELNGDIEELEETVRDMQSQADDAAFGEVEAQRLYEAIAEHRTQDAIDILQRHSSEIRFLPARVYASLFRERVL